MQRKHFLHTQSIAHAGMSSVLAFALARSVGVPNVKHLAHLWANKGCLCAMSASLHVSHFHWMASSSSGVHFLHASPFVAIPQIVHSHVAGEPAVIASSFGCGFGVLCPGSRCSAGAVAFDGAFALVLAELDESDAAGALSDSVTAVFLSSSGVVEYVTQAGHMCNRSSLWSAR